MELQVVYFSIERWGTFGVVYTFIMSGSILILQINKTFSSTTCQKQIMISKLQVTIQPKFLLI